MIEIINKFPTKWKRNKIINFTLVDLWYILTFSSNLLAQDKHGPIFDIYLGPHLIHSFPIGLQWEFREWRRTWWWGFFFQNKKTTGFWPQEKILAWRTDKPFIHSKSHHNRSFLKWKPGSLSAWQLGKNNTVELILIDKFLISEIRINSTTNSLKWYTPIGGKGWYRTW